MIHQYYQNTKDRYKSFRQVLRDKILSIKLIIISILWLESLLLATPILALDIPKASRYDPRVRYINYNAGDVVQIEAVIGIATHIIVEPDECYLTHAFGDAKAWSFANQLNHYFIKPREQDADTNLTIVTNRRTYYFKLNYHDHQQQLPMYGIKFLYPKLSKQHQQVATVAAILNTSINYSKYSKYNLAYSMCGDLDIAPINVWDDGNFTYFKFSPNQDIPGIYLVDTEQTESVVNRHTSGKENNLVVTHKINAKWMLRLGNRVLAIYNEVATNRINTQLSPADSSQIINQNLNNHQNDVHVNTGTASPLIQRIIKKGD